MSLRVIISLDVEEEGLFSGRYPRRSCSTLNVKRLLKLAPLAELGFPLTLFCSWAVFADPEACRVLEHMRDHFGAEIGAHLHHWSTPPFENCERVAKTVPPRTDCIPRPLLQERLVNLLRKGEEFQSQPLESFRMGRWDCKSKLFPLLHDSGIHVDSSVCPLRCFSGGADHFLSPARPYWALGKEKSFLEVPITQIPLHPFMSKLWYSLCKGKECCDLFHFVGALSANPYWHADWVARLSLRLLQARKEPVLSIFWHSSELLPGSSPHVPTEDAAEAKIRRIIAFFSWLKTKYEVRGMTLSQLFREAWSTREIFPERSALSGTGDW